MKYEYHCKKMECGALFNIDLPMDFDPLKEIECIFCKNVSAKRKISKSINVQTRQDYRTCTISESILDKRVGEDSDKKWKEIQNIHNKLCDASEKFGTEAVTKDLVNGEYKPLNKKDLEYREKVEKILKSDDSPVPVNVLEDGSFVVDSNAPKVKIASKGRGDKRKSRNIIPK